MDTPEPDPAPDEGTLSESDIQSGDSLADGDIGEPLPGDDD